MSAYDPAFDAAVMAGPIVDNAGSLYVIGELEGDRCGCGARIPGDVEQCDDCECTCGHPGLTYDGPAEDCPQHGRAAP